MRYYLSDLLQLGVLFFPGDSKTMPVVKISRRRHMELSVVDKGILRVGEREVPVMVFLSSVKPGYVQCVCSDDTHSAKENKLFLQNYYLERYKMNVNGIRDTVAHRRFCKSLEYISIYSCLLAIIVAAISYIVGRGRIEFVFLSCMAFVFTKAFVPHRHMNFVNPNDFFK